VSVLAANFRFVNSSDWYSRMCLGPRRSGDRWKRREKSSTIRNVTAYGSFSVITTLEFFQHHFSEMGHRGPPCDPNLSQPSCNHRFVHLTRSVRRSRGFVQVGLGEVRRYSGYPLFSQPCSTIRRNVTVKFSSRCFISVQSFSSGTFFVRNLHKCPLRDT